MTKTNKGISIKLLAWYDKAKRDLPWRNIKDPYGIWVSEIMLQQTQVKTVIPYYQRWMKALPTIRKLANSSERKVLKLWEGLGYYSRARNLKKAAQIVNKDMGGKIPGTVAELQNLPGIGRYTAGAISSIAFGVKVPVLDGNVKRVLTRLFCISDVTTSALEKRLWEKAKNFVPTRRPGDFNQALMELGATLCSHKSPTCQKCPLRKTCEAFEKGIVEQFPQKKITSPIKKIEVAAGIIMKNSKVYIQQRAKDDLMGGLWEFPGGKREKGESIEGCLKREIREELRADIKVLNKVMVIRHAYTQFRVTLHVFDCFLKNKKIRPNGCEQWKWISLEKLNSYPFPAANARIVKYLIDSNKKVGCKNKVSK